MNGDVKISDFGISKQLNIDNSHADTFVGTFSYMSPERIEGKSYTYTADIWSLGVSLLTCLLGRLPFDGGKYPSMVSEGRDIFTREVLEKVGFEIIYAFNHSAVVVFYIPEIYGLSEVLPKAESRRSFERY